MSKKFVARKFVEGFLTLLTVMTLSFILFRVMPGGPADYIRARLQQSNPGMTQSELNYLIEQYTNIAPDKPLWQQYIDYLTSLLVGDFGHSIYFQRPAGQIIAEALPWTLFIMVIAVSITYLIGIVLGAIMAYNEGSRFDIVATALGVITGSVPYYLAALVFIAYIGHDTGLFPTRGAYNTDVPPGYNIRFIATVIHHAALPILSIIITGFGIQALTMRGNAISVLGNDYLRVARLRGLPESRISIRYVMRNSILPMYTNFMISIGTLFGGSVVLESIFQYPGVGFYILEGINSRDHILLMAGFLVITFATLIGVHLADLTYGLIDPRAQSNGE